MAPGIPFPREEPELAVPFAFWVLLAVPNGKENFVFYFDQRSEWRFPFISFRRFRVPTP